MVSASCLNKSFMIVVPTAAVGATSSTNVVRGFLSPFQSQWLPKACSCKCGRAPRQKGKSIKLWLTHHIKMTEEMKRQQIKATVKTKKE